MRLCCALAFNWLHAMVLSWSSSENFILKRVMQAVHKGPFDFWPEIYFIDQKIPNFDENWVFFFSSFDWIFWNFDQNTESFFKFWQKIDFFERKLQNLDTATQNFDEKIEFYEVLIRKLIFLTNCVQKTKFLTKNWLD